MTEREGGSLRAGNEDREKVVALLHSAFAEGRLDVTELDERVTSAYAAKTLGELAPLTADLPAPYPAAPLRRAAAGPPARQDPHGPSNAVRWAPVGGALGLFLVNVLIWAAVSIGTQNVIYFWPVWTAIPLVFAVVGVIGQSAGGRNRDRHDRG
jgi:Domain of unknown function (DUF1707)